VLLLASLSSARRLAPPPGHGLAEICDVETRKGKLAVARFRAPVPGRTVGLVIRAADVRGNEYRQLAEYLRRALDRPGFAGRIERGPWAT
jgi:hypothetical protein